MDKSHKIVIDPEIRFGKPCIKNTRIVVSDILNLIASGYALEDIPHQYTELTKDDVIAAIEFASQSLEYPPKIIFPS